MKANWEGLNKLLNSVKWDDLIGQYEPEISLLLNKLMDKFIPTLLVKENNHPP